MTPTDVVTLVSPDNQDAALVAECAAFDELEAEITAYELADRDDTIRRTGRTPLHERQDECERLLVRVCNERASTLAGIAARLRILLRIAPACFVLPEAASSGCDELLTAALLRDLASILRVDEVAP
ncbi:MAG: hypothetical protein J2P47_06390 [Acetobacteraceae bacterium]|nr:hypothetical protein [Acetobacteraceae bacterium]